MPRPAPASVNAASLSIRPRTKPPSAPITPNPPAESAGPPGPRGRDCQYGGPPARFDTQAAKKFLSAIASRIWPVAASRTGLSLRAELACRCERNWPVGPGQTSDRDPPGQHVGAVSCMAAQPERAVRDGVDREAADLVHLGRGDLARPGVD